MSSPDVIEQFRAALRSHGLVPPDQLEPDGQIHRCDVEAKNGKGDGAYLLHLDGIPAGGFQNWQDGAWQTWCAKDERTLTPEEQSQFRQTLERTHRLREEEAQQRHETARGRAREIWEEATPASDSHPYLIAKGVRSHGLRLYRNLLVVPMFEESGALISLQFINEVGNKKFLKGGKKRGAYFILGQPNGVLCAAEGYSTAASLYEATGHAVAVTFDAGNMAAVAPALRSRYHEARLVFCADNDITTGKLNTGIEAAQQAARAVGGFIAIPEMGGEKCDFNDLMSVEGAEAVRHALEQAKSVAPAVTTTAVARRALPDPLPPVPPFDLSLLPTTVRPWVEDCAEGLQVPADYLAVAAMVALGGTIGRQIGIAVKQLDHWIERPILWGCIVGRPSAGKSPALRPAYSMLSRIEAQGWAQYEEDLKDFEARMIVSGAAKENAKKVARRSLEKGNTAAALEAAAAAVTNEQGPDQARLVINDSTIEKCGEILNANPRGLVLFRDELSGWLASLDREGRESDRAFWLECWAGMGPYVSDRIGRGSIRVEACAVSILGGVQPGKLAEYVRGAVRGGCADDGLMQRFGLAIYPDPPKDWRYTDRTPNAEAQQTAWGVFRSLNAIQPQALGCLREEFIDVPFLRFAIDAQELFIEWQTALMLRLRGGQEPAFLESHFAKYPALVARLALVIHLAEGAIGPVSADALARALDWTPYLEAHARRIYAPASDSGLAGAHALLAKRDELAGEFTAREVYRKGWAGLSEPESAEAALEWLVDYYYINTRTTPAGIGGRPTVHYEWMAS